MRNLRKLSRGLAVAAATGLLATLAACGPGDSTSGASTGPSTSTTAGTAGPVTTPPTTPPADGPTALGPQGDEPVDEASGDSAFQSNVTGQMTADQAYKYLSDVVTSADSMWSKYFLSLSKAQEPDFYYEIVTADKPITSNCETEPVTSTYNNAFFCDRDSETIDGVTYNGAVVLPLDTFMQMWNGNIFKRQSQRTGDFGAAVIVAHEIAHSNWSDLATQYDLPPINQPGQPRNKNNELIADCGAGVWANSAYYQGFLEAGDVEEGVAALEAIGDAGPGGSDPHGTPAERGEAFKLGYNTGKPGQCIAAYWPGVNGG
jgi:predicted metalloprotease